MSGASDRASAIPSGPTVAVGPGGAEGESDGWGGTDGRAGDGADWLAGASVGEAVGTVVPPHDPTITHERRTASDARRTAAAERPVLPELPDPWDRVVRRMQFNLIGGPRRDKSRVARPGLSASALSAPHHHGDLVLGAKTASTRETARGGMATARLPAYSSR